MSENKPVLTDWISTGENKGLAIAIWEDAITLSKQTKEGDKWETSQKINLSNYLIERLYIRLPKYYDMTKKKKEQRKE